VAREEIRAAARIAATVAGIMPLGATMSAPLARSGGSQRARQRLVVQTNVRDRATEQVGCDV